LLNHQSNAVIFFAIFFAQYDGIRSNDTVIYYHFFQLQSAKFGEARPQPGAQCAYLTDFYTFTPEAYFLLTIGKIVPYSAAFSSNGKLRRLILLAVRAKKR